MVRDWLTKAITIISEVIKQLISFQIRIAGAMLAALALERFKVLMPHTALMTIMPSNKGSGKIWSLAKKQVKTIKYISWKNISLLVLTILLGVILLLTNAISTVLVNDIGLSAIPSNTITLPTNFSFTYTNVNYSSVLFSQVLLQGTSWLRKADLYPPFAEYSKPPFLQDRVSNTSLTLQAFLPFQDAQDRQTLQEYNGKTTVLDLRVTCQVPILEGETVQQPFSGGWELVVQGTVRASTYTPRLGNYTNVLV